MSNKGQDMATRGGAGGRSRWIDSSKSWLWFVELDRFAPSWKKAGLDDEDLRALQTVICLAPNDAPVVVGTGGLRKLRFAPPRWQTGSSGAVRVYYAYFPSHGLVALVFAHAKNDLGSISEVQKRVIKGLLQQIQQYLDKRRMRKGMQ